MTFLLRINSHKTSLKMFNSYIRYVIIDMKTITVMFSRFALVIILSMTKTRLKLCQRHLDIYIHKLTYSGQKMNIAV